MERQRTIPRIVAKICLFTFQNPVTNCSKRNSQYSSLVTKLQQLTSNVKLHANLEILPVVEEAYTLGIDLHDLRLFDDIPLMSHHTVDKGEAL